MQRRDIEEKDTGVDQLSYTPEDPCNELSEENCEDDGDCWSVLGWRITETDYGYCYDSDIWESEPEWLICQSTASSLEVETVAGPADDSACYVFSDGTFPSEWVEDCNATIGLQCD